MKMRWIIVILILLLGAAASWLFYRGNFNHHDGDEVTTEEHQDMEQEKRINEALHMVQAFPPVQNYAQQFAGSIKYGAYQKDDDDPDHVVVQMIKNTGKISYVFRIMVDLKTQKAQVECDFAQLEKVFTIAANSQPVKAFIGKKTTITYRLVRLPLPDDPTNYIVAVEEGSDNGDQPITEEFRVNLQNAAVDVVDI